MKTADLNKIEKYVIYPTLGISRVGNSAAWFYAPEVPGQPADLVYISSNPATQARDLESLVFAGYELKKISLWINFLTHATWNAWPCWKGCGYLTGINPVRIDRDTW